jgi:hypothetical protein
MGTPPPLSCGYILALARSQQDKDSDPKQTCHTEINELWSYVCFRSAYFLTAPCFLYVRVKFRC